MAISINNINEKRIIEEGVHVPNINTVANCFGNGTVPVQSSSNNSSKLSKKELLANGYKVENECFVDLGHGYFIKNTILLKSGNDTVYCQEYYVQDQNGNMIPASEQEIKSINQYCEKSLNKSYNEILKSISYDRNKEEFVVSQDIVNDVRNTKTAKTLGITALRGGVLSVYSNEDVDAIKIYKQLLEPTADENKIKATLCEITSPEIFKKVEELLNQNKQYKSDYLYSSVEKFIYQKLSGSSSSNNSSPKLDTFVQRYIKQGVLKDEDAIKAQARLASRIIFDGADGFGTNEDLIDKGVSLICSPIMTDDAEYNCENGTKVLSEVNNIIKQHSTFYGIGRRFDNLEEYLKDDLGSNDIEYYNMILSLNGVKETKFRSDDITKLKETFSTNPSDALKLTIIEDMSLSLQEAITSLSESGIVNGSFFADMADAISGMWNFEGSIKFYDEIGYPCEIKGNEHGNKYNLVKKDIINYYNNIIKLVDSLKSGDFEVKFKEIFGVEYNKQNVENYNEAKDKYEQIIKGDGAVKILEERITAMNKLNDQQYKETVCSMLNINGTRQEEIIALSRKEGISERDIYSIIIEQFLSKSQDSLKKLMNGKSIEDYKKELNITRNKAFGSNNSDIIKRVDDYNVSQIEGAANCQTFTEAIAMATIMIASGGGGAIYYGAVSGLTHLGAEMINKASTYEGNTFEHTKTALWESFVDGLLSGLSDGCLKPILDKKLAGVLMSKVEQSNLNVGFVSGVYKYFATALRNFTVEFTKSLMKSGDVNLEKATIKTAFSIGVKAIVTGKTKASKYILDKAVKKAGTSASYNTFLKNFDLEDFKSLCSNDEEIIRLYKLIGEQNFDKLVYNVYNLVKNCSESGMSAEEIQEMFSKEELFDNE